MSVSIPQAKLDEVLAQCKTWKAGMRISKRNLQSLVGKLIHLTNGIKHGRKFTARLLASLRSMKDRLWTTVTKQAALDIRWFLHFARASNGISIFSTPEPGWVIECDACLTGGGGNTATQCYIWQYNENHHQRFGAIHRLEAINLVVAFKTLVPTPMNKGLHVQIYTDNMASAYALMSGKTQDETLAACARQLWLEAACQDITFSIHHKPGAELELSDALSRFHTDNAKKQFALREIKHRGLTPVEPVLCNYVFFDKSL